MSKQLPLTFFRRPAASVAREMIGATIAREDDHGIRRFTILETEAYEGIHDLASHSSKGRTARTEVMFGPAGRFYIYRIYGLHWMLNVVTGQIDEGEAILIRGVEGIAGPGRVAAALQIKSEFQGKPATRSSGLWFESRNVPLKIQTTARIGVDYAGPIWAAKKLRFVAC
jgi:DNA-3-methyladenine glycosylase